MTYAEWAQGQDWDEIQNSQAVQWANAQHQKAMERLEQQNGQNAPAAEDDGSTPAGGSDVTVPSAPASPIASSLPELTASNGATGFLPYILIGGALVIGVVVMVVMK